MKPITEVNLPSHHPAVADCKPGESVMLHAHRAPEPDNDEAKPVDGGSKSMPMRERPMPLTTSFHVTHIEKGAKANAGGEVRSKKRSATEYLKEKQTGEAAY